MNFKTNIKKTVESQEKARKNLIKVFKNLTSTCESNQLEVEGECFSIMYMESLGAKGRKDKKYVFCFENSEGKIIRLDNSTSFQDIHYLSTKTKQIFSDFNGIIDANKSLASEVESNIFGFNQTKLCLPSTVTLLKPFLIKAVSKITSFLAKVSYNADQKIREFEKPVIISKCQPSVISTESNVPENALENAEELSEELSEECL